jgi:hypothetical protein
MLATEPLRIVQVDRLGSGHLAVSYSDESTAVYSVEQLTILTPWMIVTSEVDQSEPNAAWDMSYPS